MRVRFLLICEGRSDMALIPHIMELLIACGASEADGSASYLGRRVEDKIRLGLQNHYGVNMLLIHRDADTAGTSARFAEIGRGMSATGTAVGPGRVDSVSLTNAGSGYTSVPRRRRVAAPRPPPKRG